MTLNLLNMIINEANLVSALARNFNCKKLHLGILIEHGKTHEMVHDKILYNHCIIRDM